MTVSEADAGAGKPGARVSRTFDEGRADIALACKYFVTNRDTFRADGMKEDLVRQDLIDPLFRALGWDVGNAARVAPQYCEVVIEPSLEVEGHQKAPDYAFRVGTLPKFYAEAKKCGVNISADPAPAYQLRRYGWSAKVAVSILTDFEELGVYDCSMRPRPGDKASHARILSYRFEEYPDRWRELWDIFSREAVWSGTFDHYAASKRKRGTSEVDVEFLKEIEGWRDELARNIALRNDGLSAADLNAAVQRIIDRVIFLRMAEDRRLEPEGQLLKLSEQPNIYPRFMRELCRRADEKYNSGLFHFQKESGVAEEPDSLTPRLSVDDKTLRPIIQSLYFEHGSPYHFGVLPVEILGTVYERFLGKVIRLTAGHQAKIEEKPEVRKAGGVYYTPSYIVEYIVRQTVGKRIEGRTPSQLAGERGRPPLRVLDMACGSGSFLLGAYQCLLDHCLKWYAANGPEKRGHAVYRHPRTGEWRLTIAERKRILTTHIYGVDIDAQAVEVSKLSLLLKALEGENDATLTRQLALFRSRALPNLSGNIKCGNSLVGPDYFSGRLFPDAEELRRVNPFDWNAEFPDAMKAGGFDCVIGNPPYIRIQTMKEWAPLEVEVYKERFRAARSGNYDIYVVFIEQGLKLLNGKGKLGFICPHKFFNAKYGQPVRGLIAEGRHLAHIVHFGDQQVFAGATTYTCLLFLDKAGTKEYRVVRVNNLDAWREGQSDHAPRSDTQSGSASVFAVKEAAAYYGRRRRLPPGVAEDGSMPTAKISSSEWNLAMGRAAALIRKVTSRTLKLRDVAGRIFQGLKTGGDAVFIVQKIQRTRHRTKIHSARTRKEYWIENDLLHPLIKGGDSRAFEMAPTNRLILFPYHADRNEITLIPQPVMKSLYPLAWNYLSDNLDFLKRREHGKAAGDKWYAYTRNQALDVISLPKLFTPDLSPQAAFSLDATGERFFTGGVAGGYGILVSPEHSREYVLALLNSRLLDWVHHHAATQMRGGWYSYEARFIRDLPLRMVNMQDPSEKVAHDHIVRLAKAMLLLRKQLVAAKSASHREAIQRQIHFTDKEINRLVYGLYGLTEEEIGIVEGADG